MQIVIKNPVRFEGIDYATSEPIVADDLGLRMVNAGVATRKVNLSKEYPARISEASSGEINVLGSSGKISYIHNIKNKFFASLQNGANYRTGKSLIAAPAWAAGVLVYPGYVAQNAGNAYITTRVSEININGMTTATGSAPTGTGDSPIIGADGIPWLYIGPADAALSDTSDTPAVSQGAVPASCTNGITMTTAGGTSLMLDPLNASSIFLSGAQYTTANGSGGGVNGVAAVAGYANGFAVDFYTDSPIIAMCKTQNYADAQYKPTVNGYPLLPKHSQIHPYYPYAANNNASTILDWTAKPSKVRRVRTALRNTTFTGIWVPPQYSVWQPDNPNRYRLMLEGDSFSQGGASGNGVETLCHRVAAMLGCDDVWSTAVGNTGFIWNAGGSTILSRASLVIAAAPDILYVVPTNWDASYTSAQRKAAYTQYFDTLLAALPNLIIICSGDRVPTTGVDADMSAAIAAYNHPHVKYLDANQGATTLAQTVGRSWFSGDGNAYYEGTYTGNAQSQTGSATGATQVGSLSFGATSGAAVVVTGTGTSFNSGYQGAFIFLDGGKSVQVTGYTDATHITVNTQGYTLSTTSFATGAWALSGALDGHPNVRGLEFLQWAIYDGLISVMNGIV